jgi:hypothetical protein
MARKSDHNNYYIIMLVQCVCILILFFRVFGVFRGYILDSRSLASFDSEDSRRIAHEDESGPKVGMLVWVGWCRLCRFRLGPDVAARVLVQSERDVLVG